jgi:hypothetical protein
MGTADSLSENYLRIAFSPEPSIYAWRRKDLEKLFDELLKSNIAILGGGVWLVEDNNIKRVIPLKSGEMEVFFWKIEQKSEEELYDFVERSVKETTDKINGWNLEENVKVNKRNKIWYNFEFLSY